MGTKIKKYIIVCIITSPQCKSNKTHHYFDTENYKVVMKKIKIHLNKWRYMFID